MRAGIWKMIKSAGMGLRGNVGRPEGQGTEWRGEHVDHKPDNKSPVCPRQVTAPASPRGRAGASPQDAGGSQQCEPGLWCQRVGEEAATPTAAVFGVGSVWAANLPKGLCSPHQTGQTPVPLGPSLRHNDPLEAGGTAS